MNAFIIMRRNTKASIASEDFHCRSLTIYSFAAQLGAVCSDAPMPLQSCKCNIQSLPNATFISFKRPLLSFPPPHPAPYLLTSPHVPELVALALAL